MNANLGTKIAAKRKDIGLSQIEFADRLSVTRQTVSRWENGTVMPDIDKISDIAEILGVSCDYLLRDDIEKDEYDKAGTPVSSVGRILKGIVGKKVKLHFCEDEIDVDLYDLAVTVEGFEGNWMKVSAVTKKDKTIEKLIPVSSILSFEIMEEG
ncbi:MAG: helix-turn-helix transcriptional regulator [Lachnospiraceae bacterium]|jgi:transcriptional regulator with XRE-family HTH domain|nr:helix-turn-helix transcriptional regulator [Lachnospiraceae bacterium]